MPCSIFLLPRLALGASSRSPAPTSKSCTDFCSKPIFSPGRCHRSGFCFLGGRGSCGQLGVDSFAFETLAEVRNKSKSSQVEVTKLVEFPIRHFKISPAFQPQQPSVDQKGLGSFDRASGRERRPHPGVRRPPAGRGRATVGAGWSLDVFFCIIRFGVE